MSSAPDRTRFYVNILRSDTGYAPNPFHSICTLACCRPAIRRKARKGDWVIGITPKHLGNQLAYAMHVDEAITFEQYFREGRFAAKKPRRLMTGAPFADTRGDNCYEPRANGAFHQLPCAHNEFADALGISPGAGATWARSSSG